MSDDREQKSEDRGQRSDDRGQTTDERKQMMENLGTHGIVDKNKRRQKYDFPLFARKVIRRNMMAMEQDNTIFYQNHTKYVCAVSNTSVI